MNCLLLYKSKRPHVAALWVTVGLSSHLPLSCCAAKHMLCLPGWLISSGVMYWALWEQDYRSCVSQTQWSCYSHGWCLMYSAVAWPLNMLAHPRPSIIYFLIYLVGIHALLTLAAMPNQSHFFFFSHSIWVNFSIYLKLDFGNVKLLHHLRLLISHSLYFVLWTTFNAGNIYGIFIHFWYTRYMASEGKSYLSVAAMPDQSLFIFFFK